MATPDDAEVSDVSHFHSDLTDESGTALFSKQRNHLKRKFNVTTRIRKRYRVSFEYRSYGDASNLLACYEEALELIKINRMKAEGGIPPPADDDTDDATTEEIDDNLLPRKCTKVSPTMSDTFMIRNLQEQVDLLRSQVCDLSAQLDAFRPLEDVNIA